MEELPLLSYGCVLECALWVGRPALLDMLFQCVSACDQQIVTLEIGSRLEWYSVDATQQGNCDEVAQSHGWQPLGLCGLCLFAATNFGRQRPRLYSAYLHLFVLRLHVCCTW